MFRNFVVAISVGLVALVASVTTAEAAFAPVGPIFVTLGDSAETPFTYGDNPTFDGNVSSIFAGGTSFTNGTFVVPGSASAVDTTKSLISEDIGRLGAIDFHIEYESHSAITPNAVVNLNILGAAEGGDNPSDTLSIAFSIHTPTDPTDNANTSVDLHFRSDSLDELSPPRLPPGTSGVALSIVEPTFRSFQDLSALIQSQPGVPDDFFLRHNSWSVPELHASSLVSALTLAIGGVLSLTGRRWRKQLVSA